MKLKIFKKFIVYGLIGICLEIFWTGLTSLINSDYTMEGRTYIWMFFIYGMAIFFEPIHNTIRQKNIFIRGFIYMFIIFTIEYISGFILRCIIGACPWNYTDYASIDGLITLNFIPVWFFAGLLFERIHDLLNCIVIKYNT
ncbi:MAG: putative ABC transporter permease [Eubacteriaceae bacterium]